MSFVSEPTWQPTACILCECNCGIEVRLGGEDGRRFERIRGDKAHPASAGYTCEKALRLDHYQNATQRLTSPLRRRADGSFEPIEWDTAIREIAQRLGHVRDTYGGESIFYYGGGGQGNHLGGSYSGATLRALGAKYRSNALAQEKTGEFWVNGQMFGGGVRGDFEHCDLALFIGKNPYQSHSIPRARTLLKEIAHDPARTMIVIDPRRTETAELADVHLQVRPGGDAWALAALGGVLVQEDLVDRPWLDTHTTGADDVLASLAAVPVALFCERAGLPEAQVRDAARRIAAASAVAVFEDLGIQQGLHSTLCSYLEKLVWLLTGNFGKLGAQYMSTSIVNIVRQSSSAPGATPPVSPVVGAPIISGLVPSNVVAEEILADHPRRYRAMLVESANPAHSLADTPMVQRALDHLDLLVVIDITMTETARHAHYVLPAASQYEKHEATFFNFDWPRNMFHLRRPLLAPLAGTLPEPEIHARLVEALGVITDDDLAPLRAAAAESRAAFATAFFAATAAKPLLGELAPVVLYRTLGPTLPDGAASAAILWGAAHRCALNEPASVRRAGFTGEGLELGEALFDAILASPSGVVFSVDEHDDAWRRVRRPDGRISLAVPEMLDALEALQHDEVPNDPSYPFVLSAGERRSFTANTILRDPAWRKRDAAGALRMHPDDASALGLGTGALARITTRGGSADVVVEVNDTLRPGHVTLPNGMGLDEPGEDGVSVRTGAAPNDLTSSDHRDPIAGTPYHKHVPARIEGLQPA